MAARHPALPFLTPAPAPPTLTYWKCSSPWIRKRSLWEERERRRLEILLAVDEAEASLARGEGRDVTIPEELRQLGDDVQRRDLAHLAARQNPRT